MKSKRLPILGACGALCATALALGVPLAVAQAAHVQVPASRWRVVAKTPAAPLGVVVAPTATSAWALGWGAHPITNIIFPIGRHWNGHRWSSVHFPSGVKSSGMSCAGASSPTDVWAFTGAGSVSGQAPNNVSALRLRAGRWVIVKNFPGSYVTGCNVLGPANVWVFGGEVAGIGPPIGTWHFSGSRWRLFNTGSLVIFNASVVSAKDIWAAAAAGDGSCPCAPVVARWNGRSWREMKSIGAVLPKPTNTTGVGLDNIRAFSDRDVWVLASVVRNSALSFVVAHWNGRTWSRVKPGRPGYYLPTAVPDGHGGWWSVPYLPSMSVPYLLHRAGGRWLRFPIPVRLVFFFGAQSSFFGMTHVPHSGAMLVAGTQIHRRTITGVILAFGQLPA